jgi:hypothetical protein
MTAEERVKIELIVQEVLFEPLDEKLRTHIRNCFETDGFPVERISFSTAGDVLVELLNGDSVQILTNETVLIKVAGEQA